MILQNPINILTINDTSKISICKIWQMTTNIPSIRYDTIGITLAKNNLNLFPGILFETRSRSNIGNIVDMRKKDIILRNTLICIADYPMQFLLTAIQCLISNFYRKNIATFLLLNTIQDYFSE